MKMARSKSLYFGVSSGIFMGTPLDLSWLPLGFPWMSTSDIGGSPRRIAQRPSPCPLTGINSPVVIQVATLIGHHIHMHVQVKKDENRRISTDSTMYWYFYHGCRVFLVEQRRDV